MINAMTIDLEDWFCVANLRHVISKSEWDRCELRVVDNTRCLLEAFAKHKVEATFFVLGWVAERVRDILARNGICYDSSIFPIGFHPDYGMPEAPLWIHKLASAPLTEVPLSCAEVWGRRIPCSGGAYFRIFPYFVSRYLLRQCNNQG